MEEVGAVFLGTYEPKLDEKGRLILPAKFRDQLQRGLVITRGQERCLFVFTMEEFEDFQTGLERDLAVLGSGSRVEIWNLNTWNEYLNAQEVAFANREDEVIPGLF